MTLPTFDEPFDMIPAAGGRLAHYRFGSGPDVVAVHGWPLHSATFRHLLPHLTADFTVHLFDLPGTGNTEWSGAVGMEESARALRAGVDALRLDRYALLAHDSGGVVARYVAAADRRVRGLVLAGSEIPNHRSLLLGMHLTLGRMPGGASLLAALVQIPFVRRSGIAFGTCFTDAAFADGDFAELFVRPLRRREVLDGQAAFVRSFDYAVVDRLVEVHANIHAPALCIWGEEDPFFPVGKAREMLAQFAGGARLESIPGGKLFVHEDHAAEFAAHARPFLARCFDESRRRALGREHAG
jgi:haloalkane dehalogenase